MPTLAVFQLYLGIV